MWNWQLILALIGTAVEAYFLGCLNGSVLISKYVLKDDIRVYGSGNAGLTNFFRVFGGPLTAVVIFLDVIKMVGAVLLGMLLFSLVPAESSGYDLITFAKFYAGALCMIGHMYPCMFQFKGGKGVLSGGTLLWMIDWRIALVAWGGFVLLALITKWVSLGSVWAGVSFPVSTLVFGLVDKKPDVILVLLALVSGGLLVWKHRSNIKRILKGNESRFSFHPKREKK